MYYPTNPARRLEAAIAAANAVGSAGSQARVVDVWAVALKITEAQDSPKRYVEVVNHLAELLDELDKVEAWLRNHTAIQPVRYESQFGRLRGALSPAKFHETWATVQKYFGPDVVSSLLGQYADTMGDWEDAASTTELEELLAQVSELESSVRESDEVSSEVRSFVLSQLDAIRKAIRDYPWQGITAIKRAWARASWEWASAPAAQTDVDKSFLTRAKKMWGRGVAIAVTAARVLIGGAAAAEATEKLLDTIPAIADRMGIGTPRADIPQLSSPSDDGNTNV
jgi:hypothetical protein